MTTCYYYGRSIKNGSKDKKRIYDQLDSLKKVLDDVCQLVEDDNEHATPQLRGMRELLNGPEGLACCLKELECLKTKLEPKGQRSQRMQVLLWPLKEGDVKQTLDYLERFQRSLSLTMGAGQTYVCIV